MTAGTRKDYETVTQAEREIWLAQFKFPTRCYNIGEVADIRGPLSIDVLAAAVDAIFAATPELRRRFVREGDRLGWWVDDPRPGLLDVVDLRASKLPHETAMARVHADYAQVRLPDEEDLVKFVLFRLSGDHCLWYYRCHHIVGDGYVGALTVRRIYEAYAQRRLASGPTRERRLRSLRETHVEAASPNDQAFWSSYLRDAGPGAALTRRPEADAGPQAVARFDTRLAHSDYARLEAQAQLHGIRALHVFFAAVAVDLSILSRQEQLQFNLPVANRNKHTLLTPATMANELPLRIRVVPDSSVLDVARAIAQSIAEIFPHQRYRGESIQRDTFASGSSAAGAEFGPTLNFRTFDYGMPFEGCVTNLRTLGNGPLNNLHVSIQDRRDGGDLQIYMADDARVHNQAQLEERVHACLAIVHSWLANSALRVDAVSSLRSAELSLSATDFFAQRGRLPTAGFLRWDWPAAALTNTLRALDPPVPVRFALGLPKIWVGGGRSLGTRRLRLAGDRSNAAPGHVISIDAECWRVATGSEDVLLDQFCDLAGLAMTAAEAAAHAKVVAGDFLPALAPDVCERLASLYRSLLRDEAFWQERLFNCLPLFLPCEDSSRSPLPAAWESSAWRALGLPTGGQGADSRAVVLAAFATYLARYTENTRFQVGITARARSSDDPLSALHARMVPAQFEIKPDADVGAVRAAAVAELAHLDLRRPGYLRDLVRRTPNLSTNQALQGTRPWRVALDFLSSGTDGDHPQDDPDDAARGDLLTLQIDLEAGRHRWAWDSNRLPAGQVDAIDAQWLTLLQSMITSDPARQVQELDWLPVHERRMLLQDWNQVRRHDAPWPCIHQQFEAQARRRPDAIALRCAGASLSYAALNRRANRLAQRLIAHGVRPESRVALCAERSVDLVVAVLAILKAGGGYVPLDPAYPSTRLAQALDDAAACLLVADATGRAAVGADALASLVVIALDAPDGDVDNPAPDPEIAGLDAHSLAYVIYTSGSTGRPKGVMIEHAQVTRLFGTTRVHFGFDEDDVWCLFHSIAFDVSVWELWGALCHGGTLVVVPRVIARSASDFHALLCAESVSVLCQTPTAFKPLIESSLTAPRLHRLRYVIFAGELLEPATLGAWYALYSQSQPLLVNMYGITETTVHATFRPMRRADVERPGSPIGKRLDDLRLYLLDDRRRPVPLGAVGEIHIGGAGVARGYLNRPELNAQRFLDDPFCAEPGARMYRSGDLARYRFDGSIEFLGRNDDQIKIRGFRVEPGEIEARLVEHPGVREAAVLLQREDNEDARLVAYFVPVDGVGDGLANLLRTHLRACLPEYMIPSALVSLTALPQTPHGKLDRRALPSPQAPAYAYETYEPPATELETRLAAIWIELLGVERVGRQDNFFALGGHSLLAVQVVDRLRQSGLAIDTGTVFDTPVLAALAASLATSKTAPVPVNRILATTAVLSPDLLPLIDLTQDEIDRIVARVPGGLANIQDIYALSPLQDGILFHHLLATDGDPYLIVSQMAFANRQLLDRYLAAVQQVVDRHDILRSGFFWEGLSTPVQVVLRETPIHVTEIDLDAAAAPVHRAVVQHRIELGSAPLLRFELAPAADATWRLTLLTHHLIGDASSLQFFHHEVSSFMRGAGHALPAPVPFRNLIAQVRQQHDAQAHERYFRAQLGEVTEPTLPFGMTGVHHGGAQVAQATHALPQALTVQLRAHARRLNVSLASLCHVAWAQVLARTSGQHRVVTGTVLFGRMHAGAGAERAMGLFINTLPLRLDIGDIGVAQSVRDAHARLGELLAHEHASLALAQRCSGVPAGTPLFSALFNYRHNTTPLLADTAFDGIEFLGGQERTNYPLTLSVDDSGVTLGLTTQARSPVDPQRVCGYMAHALASLAAALEHTPELAVRQLEILPPPERRLLLETWNATQAPCPSGCLHERYEDQVRRTPDAVALVFEDTALSYAQLNARANRLAHRLIALGAAPDALVGICLDRSPAMVVGLLAILKAGSAYVPLDPAQPGPRLALILADADPTLVLCDLAGRTALGDSLLGRTGLDPNDDFDEPDSNPRVPGLTPQHLAYVIYTSGSTGQPKGVQNEHRALVNRLAWMQQAYHLTPADRIVQKTSFGFDVSVWEFFWTLGSGATLVVPAPGVHQDPHALAELMARTQVTTAHFVPSMLAPFLHSARARDCRALRHVICSGEALPASCIQLLQQTLPQATLSNLYGPTEAAIDVTAWECPSDFDDTVVPIGRPIANTRIYLLDPHGEPVPLGAVGELCIGGDGVARGYLNRPGLTAERFIADPFHAAGRLYRSGDLARYLPDGNLVFLGRNDQQVKIRGFRIELGEIEACLAAQPGVREAAVVSLGAGSDQRLVAYVTAGHDAAQDAVSPSTLREALAARLPDYMVPAAFVRLDALPLTPNGKLDRRALPAPDGNDLAQAPYEAPIGPVENALADLWRELLGLESISRHDSFFALGGHSLLAVRLIEGLRQRGIGLAVSDLFQSPVLCALARTVGARQDAAVPPNAITPDTTALTPELLPLADLTQDEIDRIVARVPGGLANIQDIYALSPLQDGILFHHLLATDGDPYVLNGLFGFACRAHLDRYVRALQQVVDRHDVLRTAFYWEGLSTPAQVVLRHAPLVVTELALDPIAGPAREQLLQRFNAGRYRIELGTAPLLHLAVAHDPDHGRWLLVELLHHLVSDHSTLEAIQAEVAAIMAGRAQTVPRAAPLRNLIAQVRQQDDAQAHERYFRAQLGEVTEPTLPFGMTGVHHGGAQVAQATHALPQALTVQLRAHARRLNVSLASLCHVAWAQVLARTSGQHRVVTGTVLFGRMHAGAGAERAMGLFINTLPLRLDIGDIGVAQSVRDAHARLGELLAHEHASLALAQRCSGVPAGTPLFSALFNYRHNTTPLLADTAFDGIEFLGGQERTNYPLTLSVDDSGVTLGLTTQARSPVDPQRVCGYMAHALASLAAALEHTPELAVRQLEILPPPERRLLLETWNATQVPCPSGCLHERYEDQVRRTPDAVALVFEDTALSYAQLNARANRLAHRLIALGAAPDALVGICLDRSPAMVVGLLAILKAGSAYVPLDPAQPGPRLALILADADPTLVLCDLAGRTALGDSLLGRTGLDPNDDFDEPDSNPRVPGLTPQHLAYVIYTSGSTGQPKGVQNEHRALVNRLAWMQQAYHLTPADRIVQKTSFGFDVSVWEFFWTLGSGATLVVPAPGVHQDPHALAELMARTQVTTAHFVPPMLALFLHSAQARNCHALRRVLCGGEGLPASSVQLLQQTLPQAALSHLYGPTEGAVTQLPGNALPTSTTPSCRSGARSPTRASTCSIPTGSPYLSVPSANCASGATAWPVAT